MNIAAAETVELTAQEAQTVAKALTSYLAELRMEISGTERMKMREELKGEEMILEAVVARLTPKGPETWPEEAPPDVDSEG